MSISDAGLPITGSDPRRWYRDQAYRTALREGGAKHVAAHRRGDPTWVIDCLLLAVTHPFRAVRINARALHAHGFEPGDPFGPFIAEENTYVLHDDMWPRWLRERSTKAIAILEAWMDHRPQAQPHRIVRSTILIDGIIHHQRDVAAALRQVVD